MSRKLETLRHRDVECNDSPTTTFKCRRITVARLIAKPTHTAAFVTHVIGGQGSHSRNEISACRYPLVNEFGSFADRTRVAPWEMSPRRSTWHRMPRILRGE